MQAVFITSMCVRNSRSFRWKAVVKGNADTHITDEFGYNYVYLILQVTYPQD